MALYPGASTYPGSAVYPSQESDVDHVLRVSFDDPTTPWHERTWVKLHERLRAWDVGGEGGRDSELDQLEATTASYRFDSYDRFLDPTAKALIRDLEFWNTWETVVGVDGTAPEWTGNGGAIEANVASRQLTTVAIPHREGTQSGRFEVEGGDQYSTSTGERCEVHRSSTTGGYGTGNVDGDVVYYAGSFMPEGPWTHPTNWEIFHQQHFTDSRFGQAPLRLQVNGARTHFQLSLDTGEFPTSGDASAGTNAGTNLDFDLHPFEEDQWFDFRYGIKWSTSDDGWLFFQMKRDYETRWTTYAIEYGIQTLGTIAGDGTPANTIYDKIGFYRNAQAITNVVYHDCYRVGRSLRDVSYDTVPTGRETVGLTELVTNLIENSSAETNANGQTGAGGGVKTITQSSDRAWDGAHSFKAVLDGTATGQGIFFRKLDGTNIPVTPNEPYTASVMASGDYGDMTRIGIEYFDSGGTSLGTTYGHVPQILTTDFRRQRVTVTAPANAAKARVRFGLSGSPAAGSGNPTTIYVDAVSFTQTDHLVGHLATDNVVGGATGRVASYQEQGAGTPFDLVPNRLLWHQIHADGLSEDVYVGWVDGWTPSWMPSGQSGFQETVVKCTDGTKHLTRSNFVAASPDVIDFDEVVSADDPSFFYRLGEEKGNKLVGHHRVIRYKKGPKKGKKKRVKRWKTHETRADVSGVSGPSGTYKSTPTLGEPGLVAGDEDYCVYFAASEYATVALDSADLITRNKITVEAITVPDASNYGVGNDTKYIVAGPVGAGGVAVFGLCQTNQDQWRFTVDTTDGSGFSADGGSAAVGVRSHLMGTWDGQYATLYVDGEQVAQLGPSSKTLRAGSTTSDLEIGRSAQTSGSFGYTGWIDEVAIYEAALGADRALAHYDAGLYGFDAATTSRRIEDALALHGLFTDTVILDGSRSMPAARYAGLEPKELIDVAVDGEGEPAKFFFNRHGQPVFLGASHRDSAPYDSPLFTFGSGGIDFGTVTIADEDAFLYNVVTGTTEDQTTYSAQDDDSVTHYGKSVLSLDSLPHATDADLEAYVEQILDKYREPMTRIPTFSVIGDSADARQAILQLDQGDCVEIVVPLPGGGTTTQTSYIERRHVYQSGPGGVLVGEYAISPR